MTEGKDKDDDDWTVDDGAFRKQLKGVLIQLLDAFYCTYTVIFSYPTRARRNNNKSAKKTNFNLFWLRKLIFICYYMYFLLNVNEVNGQDRW